MATFTWKTPTDGLWNTPADWTQGTVPTATDAVVIDAGSVLYTVTIAAGTTDTVASLTMNNAAGLLGTNDPGVPYHAGLLELDGTLAFAPLSPGRLDGSLQTTIHTKFGVNAEILNGGTLDAFIQAEGNLLITGTNGVYITNEIQALSFAAVTIDAPIAEMAGTTLFDGIFQAKGANSIMNLGGAAVLGVTPGAIVNIATIQGPSTTGHGATASWTELTFADPLSQINEWNGTQYVSVESSITTIDSGGTIDLTFGRVYTSTKTLTVDHVGSSDGAGMLNLATGTITTAGLNINNGGIVQGFGTINGPVANNNGTLIALGGAASGTLTVTGALTGTGTVLFDLNNQGPSTPDPTKATLVLNSVSAGQTVIMNGGDTLVLAAPGAFAGTIQAGVGDKIVLQGLTTTSAVLNNGTLVVSNGAQQVAALHLSGSFAGDTFFASGSTVTIAPAGTQPPGQITSDFDAAFYLAHNPDVAAAGVDPLLHFETSGWREGRDPNAFFSVKYYLNQNPDVAAAGIDPLIHFEQSGWKEGRDPSSLFSTSAYLQANPDIAAAHIDPLLHYLEFGASEGRPAFIAQPHGVGPGNPLVDDSFYYAQNPDVRAAGIDPFAHYDASGWREGRNPDALFNTAFYLQQNPDVAGTGMDPLLHFEDFGWKEGRDPSVDFSVSKYLAANPDVAAAGVNPLVQYEEFGKNEGRAIFHE